MYAAQLLAVFTSLLCLCHAHYLGARLAPLGLTGGLLRRGLPLTPTFVKRPLVVTQPIVKSPAVVVAPAIQRPTIIQQPVLQPTVIRQPVLGQSVMQPAVIGQPIVQQSDFLDQGYVGGVGQPLIGNENELNNVVVGGTRGSVLSDGTLVTSGVGVGGVVPGLTTRRQLVLGSRFRSDTVDLADRGIATLPAVRGIGAINRPGVVVSRGAILGRRNIFGDLVDSS